MLNGIIKIYIKLLIRYRNNHKKEVVYHEKIADVATAKCVRDSGLLDLYDATIGLSDTTE